MTSESLPSTQSAIVAGPDGELLVRNDVPLPAVGAGMVLVEIEAVALNPVDTKMVGSLATPGAVSGFDFAGEVVASGAAGSGTPAWPCGTRVCGAVIGQNSADPLTGAFTRYTAVPSHALLRVPGSMSLEEACSLGVGIGTAGLALFRALELHVSPQTVLVYGGSTATGTLMLQFLKLKGHHPIGVCSPPNFDLVRSRGAEAVFDRSSPTLTADVLAYTGNRLKHIVDCIATAETIAACQACMGRMGGKYVTLEPFPPELLTRKRIAHAWVLQPEILCKPIGWPPPFTRGAAPADMVRWASAWYREVQEYLDQGSLKPHPVELRVAGSRAF